MPNGAGARVCARWMARSIALSCGAAIALSFGAGFASLGCNATCIRDSDCLGHSVCTENRCILIDRRDAGTSNTPSDDTNNGGSGGSAGASSGGDGAGGTDTTPFPADAGD